MNNRNSMFRSVAMNNLQDLHLDADNPVEEPDGRELMSPVSTTVSLSSPFPNHNEDSDIGEDSDNSEEHSDSEVPEEDSDVHNDSDDEKVQEMNRSMRTLSGPRE